MTLDLKLQNLCKILQAQTDFYHFKEGETGHAVLITDRLTTKQNWVYYNHKEKNFKIYVETYENKDMVKIVLNNVTSMADYIINNGISHL